METLKINKDKFKEAFFTACKETFNHTFSGWGVAIFSDYSLSDIVSDNTSFQGDEKEIYRVKTWGNLELDSSYWEIQNYTEDELSRIAKYNGLEAIEEQEDLDGCKIPWSEYNQDDLYTALEYAFEQLENNGNENIAIELL